MFVSVVCSLKARPREGMLGGWPAARHSSLLLCSCFTTLFHMYTFSQMKTSFLQNCLQRSTAPIGAQASLPIHLSCVRDFYSQGDPRYFFSKQSDCSCSSSNKTVYCQKVKATSDVVLKIVAGELYCLYTENINSFCSLLLF